MANGFLVLDDKDWAAMTQEQRDWAVYKTLRDINCRLTTLEKRPFYDKCLAFFGGVVGGFSAAIGLKFLGG